MTNTVEQFSCIVRLIKIHCGGPQVLLFKVSDFGPLPNLVAAVKLPPMTWNLKLFDQKFLFRIFFTSRFFLFKKRVLRIVKK